MSQQSKVHPKNAYKTLKIIHLAMSMGILLFMLVVYYQTTQTTFSFLDSDDIILYILPPIAIVGILIGGKLFNVFVAKIDSKDTFAVQFGKLQTASIIKYALIEGPALLAIVSYMNEGNMAYLAIAFVLLAYLLFSRPTKENIKSYLKLSVEDKRALERG